ncbi:MAG: outer membrane beta-barrel protein [Phycisphaerales bacterium]|nr:outer membrane beta-barrel protein [Hyphomonadaceae bacterium]
MTRLFATSAICAVLMGLATPAAAQDWNGPYIGGHAGYAFQPDDDGETILFDTDLDGSFGDTVFTTAPANAFSPGFCGGSANGPTPADGCSDDEDGLDYGLRAGYDWQFGNWVVGGVGEIASSEIDDSVSAFSTTPARYTMTRELNWVAAARARGGYAFSNLLFYGTAGFAWADVEHSFSTSNGVNTFTESGDDEVSGYQLGGGVEWGMGGGWRVGAEYIYTNLDDDDYTVRSGGPAPATNPFILVNAAGTDFRRGDEEFEFDSARVTLSYRFGG